jgi:hypothetical protein
MRSSETLENLAGLLGVTSQRNLEQMYHFTLRNRKGTPWREGKEEIRTRLNFLYCYRLSLGRRVISQRKTQKITAQGISFKTFPNLYPSRCNCDFAPLVDTVFNRRNRVPGVVRRKESEIQLHYPFAVNKLAAHFGLVGRLTQVM